jgi:hypothetical protein
VLTGSDTVAGRQASTPARGRSNFPHRAMSTRAAQNETLPAHAVAGKFDQRGLASTSLLWLETPTRASQ